MTDQDLPIAAMEKTSTERLEHAYFEIHHDGSGSGPGNRTILALVD